MSPIQNRLTETQFVIRSDDGPLEVQCSICRAVMTIEGEIVTMREVWVTAAQHHCETVVTEFVFGYQVRWTESERRKWILDKAADYEDAISAIDEIRGASY